MRGSSHRMIRWWGLSMEATCAIAFVANDAACSSRCRLAAGRAIHSRMIARRALCSGIMVGLLHQLHDRLTYPEACSLRTGLLDERLPFAGPSCASCFSPCIGLHPRNLVLSHQRSDLMFDGHCRRKFYLSSEPVCAHWALLSSAFDCFFALYKRILDFTGFWISKTARFRARVFSCSRWAIERLKSPFPPCRRRGRPASLAYASSAPRQPLPRW
jgi:hypothetical protein